MRHTNRALGVAAAIAATLMSGCGTPDEPAETLPPATSRPDTSASSSPDDTAITSSQAPTEADPGEEAAAMAVVEFWTMVDKVSQNPNIDINELGRVARGQAVKQWVSNIQGRRDRNSVQTGDTLVTVTGVKTIEESQRYEVTACLDWSAVKFDGEKPDRGEAGDQQQITYVLRPDALSDGELFVTDDPLEYEPCAS